MAQSSPLTPSGLAVVNEVRSLPALFPTIVGGIPAESVDSTAAILSRFPLALFLIAAIAFLVDILMFKSVLIPLKALVRCSSSKGSGSFTTRFWTTGRLLPEDCSEPAG